MTTPKVSAVPAGYHSITPYLIIKGAAKAIDFYKKIFNAKEMLRVDGPNGSIGHAELSIGDSVIMLADEHPEMNAKSPESPPVSLLLYVEGVDSVFQNAVAAGAKVERPIADMFYGDRQGSIVDPFGHKWTISTHIEDVSPEEIERRVAALGKQ